MIALLQYIYNARTHARTNSFLDSIVLSSCFTVNKTPKLFCKNIRLPSGTKGHHRALALVLFSYRIGQPPDPCFPKTLTPPLSLPLPLPLPLPPPSPSMANAAAEDQEQKSSSRTQQEGSSTPLLVRHLPVRRFLSFPSFVASSFRLETTVWSELGGSVGDLGTYIPIVLALSLVNGLDLGTTLVFTALYNAATGLLFGIPMPVQPMKSIAAVAISESSTPLSIPEIMAAGLSTAAVLFLLGATGLMSFLYRFIPIPVVRGVQLSQGLSFAFSAIKYIRYDQDFAAGKSGGPRPWLGFDGLVLALSALLFIILVTGSGGDEEDHDQQQQFDFLPHNSSPRPHRRRRRKSCIPSSRIPAALLVFLLGLILCFVRDPSILGNLRFGPSKLQIVKMTWDDWKVGFLRAAIPQIPLSVLNSVIAVCKLSADLFPQREASVAAVSVSVGAMNLVGCWFGAMPVCHGAGGLAGQYRFGGRSGAAVLFLAVGKLALGLAFGSSFVRILGQFPIGILGVLLLFSGIELAMASRDMGTKEESFVMLICAAVSLTGSSAALGFVCGILLYLLLRLRDLDCCFPLPLRNGGGWGTAQTGEQHY